MKAIYISIKPEHIKRIISGIKNYEFRKYISLKEFDTMFIYVSSPICKLKYIIKISDIIKYPNKILENGYGNDDFNKGLKSAKYAYKIDRVYELDEYISLKDLKEKFNFNAPQRYAYDYRYPKLTEYLKSSKKIKII